MKVLVIGSGAREHALVWKISQSKKVDKIFCIPGNPGIAKIAQCVDIKTDNFYALGNFAKENDIGLTVVGPEVPLVNGLTDYFESLGLKVFGANKAAAMLEGSKAFSKNFMQKHKVPTAKYGVFTNIENAEVFLDGFAQSDKIVIKTSGLAAGKGVVICENSKNAKEIAGEFLSGKAFGVAGKEIVIEEFLNGEEVSVLIFTDGKNYSIMPASQDHKRVFDNDQGPNTGGMGAYCPAPIFTNELKKKTEKLIIKPVLDGLHKDGINYKGVLYIGLMINNSEPSVLEFNCRFGDPETQALLPLLKTDFVEIAQKINENQLDKINIDWYNKSAVCVVLSSAGYPGEYKTGQVINGLDNALKQDDILIFHAGTKEANGVLLTSGGRVLGVTAIAENIKGAIKKAYEAVEKISFEGMHYRKDIAKKAL